MSWSTETDVTTSYSATLDQGVTVSIWDGGNSKWDQVGNSLETFWDKVTNPTPYTTETDQTTVWT